MKIVIERSSLRTALRWTQRLFFCVGILLLGYCAFVLVDSWLFQRREARRLDSILRDRQNALTHPTAIAPTSVQPTIGLDGLVGRIVIPRLGVSAVVVEGVDKPVLRRAAGHIPGTAFPGQIGNIGIAAHRDAYFRPLRNIRRDDLVALTTLRGEFRYRVVSTKIVNPEDVAVLDPDGTEILTLITCYPFYFVGPAPNRFIVRAERID